MKKTILITGGAGFIGSMVNLLLQKEGFDTVVLDNFSTGRAETVISGDLIAGDIGNSSLLDEIFSKYSIEAVMHFAAKTEVAESLKDPASYYETNVADTLTLLHAMRKAGIFRFIFSSSASVYGIPTTEELKEDSPCIPISPYGESKLIIEKVLRDYYSAYQFSSCSLRYFNAAGGDPHGLIKYSEKRESNLIPIVLNCLLKGEPVTVYGNDYPTFDGTCIRDYVHVTDLADAHILALKKLLTGNALLCYNLGNKQGFSVLDVIRTIEEVTKEKVQLVMGKRRPGDPPKLIANAEKAAFELNWRPRYPELIQMVEHAWIARKDG